MSDSPSPWWLTASLLVAGVALVFVPGELTEPVRAAVRDLVHPARNLSAGVAAASQTVSGLLQDYTEHQAELALLREQLRAQELLVRQQAVALAQLQSQQASVARESATFSGTGTPPLLLPQLVDARVIGAETAAPWKGRKLLAAGSAAGMEEALLVIEAGHATLDQGREASVAVGLPVFAGRSIIGRIATVGRWTSTLQPVTDPKFRGLARILRKNGDGWETGPAGNLRGMGEPLCRLEWIPANAHVEVGDLVFTAEEDGILPAPMYYGRVSQAELKSGALHWEIRVEPVATEPSPQRVQVLRTVLNPAVAN